MNRTASNVLSLALFAAAALVAVFAWRMATSPSGERAAGGPAGYRVLPAPFPAGTITGTLVAGTAANASSTAGREGEGFPEGCPKPEGPGEGAVWIEAITAGAAAKVQTARLSIGTCGFEPAVAIGLAGSTARVEADGQHRVQASVDGVRIFDAANSGDAAVTLVDPGLWSVRCASGHPWERGWVAVAAHPYQVLTDAEGRFELRHVPEGTWTLRAWHPRLGAARRTVDVKSRETTAVELLLQ